MTEINFKSNKTHFHLFVCKCLDFRTGIKEDAAVRPVTLANRWMEEENGNRHVGYFNRFIQVKNSKTLTCPSRRGWGRTVWPRSLRKRRWNRLKSGKLSHKDRVYSAATPSFFELRPHVFCFSGDVKKKKPWRRIQGS